MEFGLLKCVGHRNLTTCNYKPCMQQINQNCCMTGRDGMCCDTGRNLKYLKSADGKSVFLYI